MGIYNTSNKITITLRITLKVRKLQIEKYKKKLSNNFIHLIFRNISSFGSMLAWLWMKQKSLKLLSSHKTVSHFWVLMLCSKSLWWCFGGIAGVTPKSLASHTGNVRVPMLMSQAGRMREVMCVYISVFLQSEWWGCQYLSAYIAAVITWLR